MPKRKKKHTNTDPTMRLFIILFVMLMLSRLLP